MGSGPLGRRFQRRIQSGRFVFRGHRRRVVGMPNLIEYLEGFNRKERFFLLGTALGNPKFGLAEDFRTKLSNAFGLTIPPDAFVAMDYHPDWIHAGLFLASRGNEDNLVHRNTEAMITGNQEDIDLIVAFEEVPNTYILLLEAKAETSWTNKQLNSKARRLSRMFGADGTEYSQIKPHFGLISPRRPQQLDMDGWPAWMTRGEKPIWLRLCIPPGRRRIVRCDRNGRRSVGGGFFRMLPP